MKEADTCRVKVHPALERAGWDTSPHSIAEQRSFTDGRIVVAGSKVQRLPGVQTDYLLRYPRDLTPQTETAVTLGCIVAGRPRSSLCGKAVSFCGKPDSKGGNRVGRFATAWRPASL